MKSHDRIEKYEEYETYRPSIPAENRDPNQKNSRCRKRDHRLKQKKEAPGTKSISDMHIMRANLEKKLNSVLNLSADLYSENALDK